MDCPGRSGTCGAGTLVNRLGGFVLIFLTIYLTKERGFSDIQAGLVVGLWSAGGGDRHDGRRRPRRPLGPAADAADRTRRRRGR